MPTYKLTPLPRNVPTTPERSRIMSAIRGKGNKSTEERLRKLLKEQGIKGWRCHLPFPGRPDFCFPKFHLAIFVDGCYWHGCPACFKLPKQNTTFWAEKIARNRTRDRRNTRKLRSEGWSVMRIWEHSLSLAPSGVTKRLHLMLRRKGYPFSD
jgi:DNA mismatch endonuclease, patch repair protein